ncbi:MAG: extracellular solute-binding protein [Clostridiales bacterium]|jgi:ABC-type glycerol-3-phosphate transport system substrate-binding protein|nr:extracellular solute-binding protein [Clostridiales bacterium]
MKSNWKKIFSLILISTMLIFALTACSNGGDDAGAPDPTKAPTAPAEDEADKEDEVPATPTPTPEPKDLKGTTIVIADWWTTDPNPEPKNQREEDTLRYREEFMDEYNFTITRENIGTFGDYTEIMVASIMAGDPAADIFTMHAEHVAAPLTQGLLYPLDTLENFDFTEEKWNPQIRDMLTMDGNVYGMATGRMEPRLGIFWNKRLFEEAGIDPDLPYELQAKDEWTWEALEDLAKRNTRDTDNDTIPDVYGIASFSKDWFRGCVFSNDAKFIGLKDGKFYNATSEPNFLEALEWGYSIYEKGYYHPLPEDYATRWDWFIEEFKSGSVAMQCAEQYKVNTWADMEDDWGFVIFPKGPKGEMMTAFTENSIVMPVTLDKDRAEDVAFAYNLYTEITPGYEDEDWKLQYYPLFRDIRAVEETLPLFYEAKHGMVSLLAMIPGIDYGNVTYDLDAGTLTAAESVEKVVAQWQVHIDKANGLGD